ncbi:MAG: hypothetical protein MHPSP_001095 [Paramarteilia canceri]
METDNFFDEKRSELDQIENTLKELEKQVEQNHVKASIDLVELGSMTFCPIVKEMFEEYLSECEKNQEKIEETLAEIKNSILNEQHTDVEQLVT